jgi:hypothetical protein
VLALGERGELQRASDSNDIAAYQAHEQPFAIDRGLAFAGYGLAAVGLAVGVVLRVRSGDDRAPAVIATPTSGGMLLGVEVRR